ncbi:DUF503 domain-containing protein [Massilibacterium senegalense]|uniref:DUF503 domain-containing protein n=1 Tax=Massilibacterium senegalense TaxID=1632858 RepID=UPI00078569B9|nr:DUF503 domain-containing protein [Massilibacterium senegalense]
MIGYVRCECFIYDANSLKEKRSVLKSIITRLKGHFNIAVSEIEEHDKWQKAVIGIVTIATTQKRAEQELQKAISMMDQDSQLELIDITYEWL